MQREGVIDLARPQAESKPAQPTGDTAQARQLVKFSFYHVDPLWRRLPSSTRKRQGNELLSVVHHYAKRLMVLSYSLAGMKAGVDFMLWSVADRLETLQEMSAAILQTEFGGYLTMPHSFLSMTKRSTYVDKLDPEHQDRRRFITSAHSKYFFVYPFVKTREWYQLPFEQRQAMMDEHIQVGNKYPSVKLHTTYSFGLDDHAFVVAFETDKPQDFLDLVMELRETNTSRYTLRDTPIFTCIATSMEGVVKELGG